MKDNDNQAKGKSNIETKCPYCNHKLDFEFTHEHEFNTTSKLVRIAKAEKDHASN